MSQELDRDFIRRLDELDESVVSPSASPQATALAGALFIVGVPAERIPTPAKIDSALALMDRSSLPSPSRRRRNSADDR